MKSASLVGAGAKPDVAYIDGLDYDLRQGKSHIVGCAYGHVQQLKTIAGPLLPAAIASNNAGYIYDMSAQNYQDGASATALKSLITGNSGGVPSGEATTAIPRC